MCVLNGGYKNVFKGWWLIFLRFLWCRGVIVGFKVFCIVGVGFVALKGRPTTCGVLFVALKGRTTILRHKKTGPFEAGLKATLMVRALNSGEVLHHTHATHSAHAAHIRHCRCIRLR